MPIDTTPLNALTLIAAPAVLTNAASLLALSTSNRFARTVDRTRALGSLLERTEPNPDPDPLVALRRRQFDSVHRRLLLLLRALRFLYLAIGLLAASSLIALLGAILDRELRAPYFNYLPLIALASAAFGVLFVSLGCVTLIRETRLTYSSLGEEAELIRRRFQDGKGRDDVF